MTLELRFPMWLSVILGVACHMMYVKTSDPYGVRSRFVRVEPRPCKQPLLRGTTLKIQTAYQGTIVQLIALLSSLLDLGIVKVLGQK